MYLTMIQKIKTCKRIFIPSIPIPRSITRPIPFFGTISILSRRRTSSLSRRFSISTRITVAPSIILVRLSVRPFCLYTVLLLSNFEISFVFIALVIRTGTRAGVAFSITVIFPLFQRFRPWFWRARAARVRPRFSWFGPIDALRSRSLRAWTRLWARSRLRFGSSRLGTIQRTRLRTLWFGFWTSSPRSWTRSSGFYYRWSRSSGFNDWRLWSRFFSSDNRRFGTRFLDYFFSFRRWRTGTFLFTISYAHQLRLKSRNCGSRFPDQINDTKF